ncbi:MAG: phosphatidylserine decarboxylase family protein [bacterium]|nr:phosphatidylserine decarboxylase family protein [bacterium]
MIAREGLLFIFSGLFLSALTVLAAVRWDSFALLLISILLSFLTIFTIFFFRDPDRNTPQERLALISPADGKIIGIEELENHEYIGGPATKISIFLSVFDVHVNRVPMDGTVDYVKYNPGQFFAAFEEKASEKNEQTEIGLTVSSGSRVVVKQIAGLIARRIICRLAEGETVRAGERFGMIKFGSRTELFVPADSKIAVKLGDKVAGAASIIGYLSESGEK